jgi:uncharacterized protein (DUF362 family)
MRCKQGKKSKSSKDGTQTTSRRAFLQTTAGVFTTAAIIGGCRDGDSAGNGEGGPDEEDSSSTPRDSSYIPGPTGNNRVVRITNPNATTWDGGSPADFYQYAVQNVVDSMIEEGVLALTGEQDLRAAWESLIPYSDGDLVVIHINAYVNNENDRKNNVAAPISAIVHGLVDILEIPAANVAVTDPSRRLLGSAAQQRIIDGCRHNESLSWDLYRGEWGGTISFTEGQGPNEEERIARIIEEADHVIMMPVLSWHSFRWITGSMKMMMGSISNMGALHSAGSGDWRDSAALADICIPFKDKVRLLAADGLFGNIDGNSSSPHLFQTLGGGGNHPSSTIYLSKDMVALDSVMYDDLLDEARAQGSPKSGHAWGFLSWAADASHGLGTFEMREETNADHYSKIDLVEIAHS